jgi:hypothetical protein
LIEFRGIQIGISQSEFRTQKATQKLKFFIFILSYQYNEFFKQTFNKKKSNRNNIIILDLDDQSIKFKIRKIENFTTKTIEIAFLSNPDKSHA